MIHPTIGRVVLFWPAADEAGKRPDQPFPALIAYVHSEHLINVGGFAHNGQPFAATSVPLLQDDDELAPSSAYAEWMPYQLEQARKAATETKVYADGTSATGTAPLPDQSPAQQGAAAAGEGAQAAGAAQAQ